MPVPLAIHECGPHAGLYQRLRALAIESPTLAYACTPLLANAEQKDRILRQAFQSAVARDPLAAQPLLELALDRPWLAETNLFNAISLAHALKSDAAIRLLLASAKRHPELALQEFESYRDLPFADEVFAIAVLLAPDRAVSLAARTPALREVLHASTRPELQTLAALDADPSIDAQTKTRAALFYADVHMSRQRAIAVSRNDGSYFQALVSSFLSADEQTAPVYERAMTVHAQTMFRDYRDHIPTERMTPRDVYFLLTLGRAEEDDALFGGIFDRLLLPTLKGPGKPFARLMAETKGLRLRAFLAAVVAHHRLPALQTVLQDFWGTAMGGIEGAADPMEEAVTASEIIEGAPPAALGGLATALASNASKSAIYGLLATRVALRLHDAGLEGSPELELLSKRYARFFPHIDSLPTARLFNEQGVCVQRMFFYHDDDGVDSYHAFRQAYAHDPRWKTEEHEGWVKIIGGGGTVRRVEIFANVPIDKTGDEEELARQAAVTRLLAAAQTEPSVIVHRGHSFHLRKTLPYLHSDTQLVYLGSCRGLQSMAAVIEAAPEAQVIATREVGTMSINDPLLKALNDELLTSGKPLDWAAFWKAQERRLGVNPMFAGYLPPDRNGAALLISAYLNYLSE